MPLARSIPWKFIPKPQISAFLLRTLRGETALPPSTVKSGWLAMPNAVHRMTAAEAEAARIDAQLHFPIQVREIYKEFRVRPGEEIAGRPTVLVSAKATGKPDLGLYFDRRTVCCCADSLYGDSAGRNPLQIDYADYRVTDGVKIPYKWTQTRPNESFIIQIDQVQQNVPVDEKLFVMPSEKPAQ